MIDPTTAMDNVRHPTDQQHRCQATIRSLLCLLPELQRHSEGRTYMATECCGGPAGKRMRGADTDWETLVFFVDTKPCAQMRY